MKSELKFRKRKEDIRNQILNKLWFVRNKKGILFFDEINELKEDIKLNKDDIEVLLMKLNNSKKILVTTKYLFVIKNDIITKIEGKNIDRFDYMEFVNGYKIIESKSKIKIWYLRFKINRRIGTYRIVKKDKTFVEVKIKKTKFADCLNDSVKKLKFVASKYEGY